MSNNIKGFIITESAVETSSPQILDNNNGNIVRFKATLQDGDVPNRNKRIYGLDVLKEAVQQPYIKERLETKSFYGEAGHPLKPDMARQLYIDQSNISHVITDIHFEGNKMKGIIETADTQRGRDMKGLITSNNSRVAFSMRGMGGVTQQEGEYLRVKSPLNIFTFDWVIHPSHQVAYMDNILTEDTINNFANISGYSMSEKSDHELFNEAVNVYENGIITDIEKEQVFDFIKNESANFKNFDKQFGLSEGVDYSIDPNGNFLDVQKGSEILKIYLEDYVVYELDDYLISKF